MKKIMTIAVGSLVVGMIISPVLGMAIGGTRELILGMAPNDAVLQLADKIDSNRVESDSKATGMQSLIDSQKKQIEDQQKIIDSQKSGLDAQQAESDKNKAATQAAISNEQSCRKAQELYVNVPDNKNGSCRTLGPTNIVQAYEKAKESYRNAKAGKSSDKKASMSCSKKYLDIVEPLYNEYLRAKGLCK